MNKQDGRKLDRKALEYLRISAIQSIEKGQKPAKVAQSIGLCRQTIYKWLNKKRKGGIKALMMRRAPGARPLLSNLQLLKLKRALCNPASKYNFKSDLWNAERVRVYVIKMFNIKYSIRGIRELLKREGYSVQKPQKKATEQQKRLTKWWLKVRWPQLLKKAKKERRIVYFEDESGIRSDHVTGRTWALRGHTPKVRRPASWENIGLLSAISPCGRLQFMTSQEKIDTKIYIQFISRILRHHFRRKILLILDNSGPHKSKIAQNFYKKNKKRLWVEFLPPYSPELNPDEFIWAILKKRPINQTGNSSIRRQVIKELLNIRKNRPMIKNLFLCLVVA